MNPTLLIIILVIGVVLMLPVGAVVLCFLGFLGNQESPVQARFRDLSLYTDTSDEVSEKTLKETLLERLTPLSIQMYGQNNAFLESTRTKLVRAGLKDTNDVVHRHLASKLLGGLSGMGFGFVGGFASQQP